MSELTELKQQIAEIKQLTISGFEALGLQHSSDYTPRMNTNKAQLQADRALHNMLSDTPIHSFKKKPKDKREKKEVEYSEGFLEIWDMKPHRNGNSKQDANKEYLKKISENIQPLSIFNGVARYSNYVRATGDICVYKLNNFIKNDLYLESWDIPKQHKELKRPPDDKLNQFATDNELTYPAPTQCKSYDSYWNFLKKEYEKKHNLDNI